MKRKLNYQWVLIVNQYLVTSTIWIWAGIYGPSSGIRTFTSWAHLWGLYRSICFTFLCLVWSLYGLSFFDLQALITPVVPLSLSHPCCDWATINTIQHAVLFPILAYVVRYCVILFRLNFMLHWNLSGWEYPPPPPDITDILRLSYLNNRQWITIGLSWIQT
jgi:hypothetical protein